MFKDSNARRELALALLHEFKEHLYPPGTPCNEQNMALVFRNLFILTDVFAHVEAVKKEDLVSFGRPQPMVPQHMQPQNGAPRQAQAPVQVVPDSAA